MHGTRWTLKLVRSFFNVRSTVKRMCMQDLLQDDLDALGNTPQNNVACHMPVLATIF